MDILTHALMGAHVAHVGTPADRPLSPRERLLLGGLAAAFPDIDFVGFLVDPLRFLAHWHQGPTHSLLLLPFWAALLGASYCGITRRRQAFGEAVAVSSLGLASHIVLDVTIVYGTQVLYPVSDQRFSLGTTFVIDPLFTAINAISLTASLRSDGRRVAAIGLLLLVVYVGVQGLLRLQALRVASEAARNQVIERGRVDALPQPFSPVNWKLVATQGASLRVAHVNLVGHPALVPPLPDLAGWHAMARAYAPPDRLAGNAGPCSATSRRSARWRSRSGTGPTSRRSGTSRSIPRSPALSRVDEGEAYRCVWFPDLRYDLPALPDTFRYGHCQAPPGAPRRLFRLRYFTQDGLQPLM